MKNTTKISIAFLLLISFTVNAQFKKIAGDGNVITKNRTVGNFDKLTVSGSFDVELIKGIEGAITIKAESNLMDYIETNVDNGTLKISFKNGLNIRTHKSIQITLAFNDLESVKLSGSGEIISNVPIEGTDLDISLSGSGNLKMNVVVDNLSSSISGSGNINLNGNASNFSCSVSGSGNTNASDLKTLITNAKISGSGNVKVHAENEIQAKTSGSGNISYTGNPTIIKANSSGSGSIQKRS
jgi:hypothetical protein